MIMKFKVTHKPRIRGAGDVVAIIAEPIKRTLMAHGPVRLQKYLENCRCAERRSKLNKLLPL